MSGHQREDLRERGTVRPTPVDAWGWDSQQYGNSVDQQVDSGVDGTVQPVVWGYTCTGGWRVTHWSDGTTTRVRFSDIWQSPQANVDRPDHSRREQLGVG